MKEDKAAILYFPFGDEYARTMTAIIAGVGEKLEIKQPRWSWFERERMEVTFTVDNGPVNAASGLYTVDIPASEVDAVTGYSWPTATSVWQHVVSGKNFYIQSKPDANTLVLKPVNSSTAVTLEDGDKFFYVGQTSPEKSGAPVAQYYFSTEFTVGTQNIRHSKDSSGNALYNQMWYNQLQNGVSVPYSNSQDIFDLQRIHNVSFVNQFLTNQLSNNLTDSESFNSLSSTEGMYDGLLATIQSRGQVEDTGGAPDVTDFYALEAKLSKQDGDIRDYAVWMPGLVFNQVSTSMLEYLKQTNIATTNQTMVDVYYDGNMSTENMRTTLDFQTLTFGGKNFHLTRFSVLDNPQTFNSTAQATNPWQNYAFFIPVGKGANDGNGMLGKYVRIVHKPQRFMKMWDTGAMANQNKTRVDELAIDILSEYSVAFINANNYGLFYKA